MKVIYHQSIFERIAAALEQAAQSNKKVYRIIVSKDEADELDEEFSYLRVVDFGRIGIPTTSLRRYTVLGVAVHEEAA